MALISILVLILVPILILILVLVLVLILVLILIFCSYSFCSSSGSDHCSLLGNRWRFAPHELVSSSMPPAPLPLYPTIPVHPASILKLFFPRLPTSRLPPRHLQPHRLHYPDSRHSSTRNPPKQF